MTRLRTKSVRSLALGLLAVMLAGLVPASSAHRPLEETTAALPPLPVPPAVQDVVRQAAETGEDYVDLDLMPRTAGALDQLKQAVAAAGGEITLDEKSFVRARVPAAAAGALADSAAVAAVGVNQSLSIDPVQVPPSADPIPTMLARWRTPTLRRLVWRSSATSLAARATALLSP